MEFDQIFKRLDWLDEEHRKDKAAMEALSEKLANTNGELKIANKKIKELTAELSQFSTVLPRIDQFNEALTNQRVEILKYVDEMDNKDVDKLPQAEKRFQVQIDTINKSITELRKLKDPLAEIRREIKDNAAEEARHNTQISEWEKRLQEVARSVEEVQIA